MKNKKIAIIVIILLILLIPIPFKLKDGGTIEWKSLTYSISKVNSIYSINDIPWVIKKKIVIKIFNITVFNNSKYDIEKEFVIVDSSKNNENFACDSDLEEIYTLKNFYIKFTILFIEIKIKIWYNAQYREFRNFETCTYMIINIILYLKCKNGGD